MSIIHVHSARMVEYQKHATCIKELESTLQHQHLIQSQKPSQRHIIPNTLTFTSTHQSITPTSEHTKKDKEKEVNHSNPQSNPPRQTTQMAAINPTLLLIFVGQRHHQSIQSPLIGQEELQVLKQYCVK